MLSFRFCVYLATFIGSARSWDVAVTSTDKLLYYYKNGTAAETRTYEKAELSALAYDPTAGRVILADANNATHAIFGVTSTGEREPLVRNQNDLVTSVAFDHVTKSIFWITGNQDRGIYKKSLKPGHGVEQTVLKRNGSYAGIAVDSIRGYVYWAEHAMKDSVIKRSKLDGTEEKMIVNVGLFSPTGLAVDHKARRLYWVDNTENQRYKIESSDLDGRQRRTIVNGLNQTPKDIAVGDTHIFWRDTLNNFIWAIPIDSYTAEPTMLINGTDVDPQGLTASYTLVTQNGLLHDVSSTNISPKESGERLLDNESSTNISPKESGARLLHNGSSTNTSPKESGERLLHNGSSTNTSPKESGERLFHNVSSTNISPKESGERLLHNGSSTNTSPKESGERLFHNVSSTNTSPKESGERLRSSNVHIYSTDVLSDNDQIISVSNENRSKFPKWSESKELDTKAILRENDGYFVESARCTGNESDVRDTIIVALGALCGLLCIACAVLLTKIMQLKKRPRIKKRIIVNKNVTPLTARPEQQCEITIENCCNMNICETPCFEPRSTIRPKLLGTKAGKEEKKNLIANMEHPDDIY